MTKLRLKSQAIKRLFCHHEGGRRNYSCLCFYQGSAGKVATVYCRKCGKKIDERFLTLMQIHILED